MTTFIRFTSTEWTVLSHRLEAPSCIAEALSDAMPGEPDNHMHPYAVAHAVAEQLDEGGRRVFLTSDLHRAVIADCVEGSTFANLLIDDTPPDAGGVRLRKYRRAHLSIQAKLADVGIDASFPMIP